MWTSAFWKAAAERMVRGGVAALGGALVAGDWIIDVVNINTWEEGATIFVGGAIASLVMSLAGNTIGGGSGPSFTGKENLTAPQ